VNLNLTPIAIAAGIVGTALLVGTTMGQEQAQAERDDLLYRLEEATSRPFPTVTERIKEPPKTLPPTTIFVTVTPRATERASRSNVRESARRFTYPRKSEGFFTGWKARYWVEGQVWAQTPKVRAVIMCESTDRVGAVSSTGKYHGLYQFDRQTWASYGGLELAPLASKATRAEQNYVAYRLYTGRGWKPWGCA
jgi:hypothetical protein